MILGYEADQFWTESFLFYGLPELKKERKIKKAKYIGQSWVCFLHRLFSLGLLPLAKRPINWNKPVHIQCKSQVRTGAGVAFRRPRIFSGGTITYPVISLFTHQHLGR